MIPRLWPNSTIVCIGNGPSRTMWEVEDPAIGSTVARPHPDVTYCRGRARVLAIKKSFSLAPWADGVVLDCYRPGDVEQPGYLQRQLVGADPSACAIRIMPCLQPVEPPANTRLCYVYADGHATGLSRDPSVINQRGGQGHGAINAAVHLGAKRIVLLGYDHTDGARAYPGYETLVSPLRALGIDVLNASRQTELTVFPRVTLAEALS